MSPSLVRLREVWSSPLAPASFSVILESTNDILSSAAKATQRIVHLGKPRPVKPTNHPEIRAAQKKSLEATRHYRSLSACPQLSSAVKSAKAECAAARSSLRSLTRTWQQVEAVKRDQLLSSILDKNPKKLYSFIRSSKSTTSGAVQRLSVEEREYFGASVPDGFYDSLSSLKDPSMDKIRGSASFQQYDADYQQILKICSAGLQIPQISGKDAVMLLHSLRPEVTDLYGTTASHYINAGMEGARHFTFLLNSVINSVNLSSLDNLNSVWAMILHKGHGKDRESDRSYRTISTCPLISKALDRYVGRLFESGWAAAQAETQFQGTGSSHELAALLLTETIQNSIFVQKQPIFVLFLDAKSAFDKILCELVIRAAFLAGSEGEGLLYLNNRLKNRKTFVEWSKTIMGPILDKLGVEQGGINSDRLYKLANNVELLITQSSGLGVQIGPEVHVASIGQADDVALVSNCIYRLQGLLQLAMEYAAAYHVTMVPEKTKLLCYSPHGQKTSTDYLQSVSSISMGGLKIPFSLQADHVGVARCSANGAMGALLARLSAHTRALHAVLPAGLARGHLGNPAASLKVEEMYGLPVLLSGLASMVLGIPELDALDHHYKVTLERLLRLYPRTPAPFVYLLSGRLPARAVLHLRQLTLLGMIARMGSESILYRLCSYSLNNPPPIPHSSSSTLWFVQVQQLCSMYGLPCPLKVLAWAPGKGPWKALIRRQVLEHWGSLLRAQAADLPSLAHLRPSHLSLSTPSRILTSCGNSGHEVRKMTVQIRMSSGRYRTCWLRRHWSEDSSGACRVPGCTGDTPGTLLHLATGQCPGLASATASAVAHWQQYLVAQPHLSDLLLSLAASEPDDFLAFLLDPCSHAASLALAQQHGQVVLDQLCHLTRSWLYTHHLARFRALDLWERLI